jgi:hypothetical protein
MQERKAKLKPFQNSLRALAQFALNDCGAEGYAFFRKTLQGNTLVREDSFGHVIGETDIASGRFATYEIGTDAVLVFAFQDEVTSMRARANLDRIAESIEAMWQVALNAGRYSELASEVADLEVRLMDSKIADRVRGLPDNHGDSNAVEAIARHVEGVLRPAPAGRMLEQLTKDLEEEVEERRLTNRAKTILQGLHGMSEEEAHKHLRQASRKTRRKLRDIAIDVIEGRSMKEHTGTP